MIPRRLHPLLVQRLNEYPAVALLGPRQVGKTTLALALGETRPSLYLDLESAADRAKLTDPELYLTDHENVLVILDEVHRLPNLFQPLRGLIDRGRRLGKRTGRFLLLGSASLDLIQQSGETLAGRIAYLELAPVDVTEIAPEEVDSLWIRGGFPDSLFASDDAGSLRWRQDFIRTYLERDIPQLGPRIPAETLRRFWTMLAHQQGGLVNAAQLARGLGVDGKTVARYLDLLVDLLLVRRLPPWYRNVGKRLVKSPKIFIRDSGITHALLGLPDKEAILGHPTVGASWEGFVLENILTIIGREAEASFYRTATGAEVDLVLTFPDDRLWVVEIKRSVAPKVGRGFYTACADLHPERRFVVYAGTERFPLGPEIEAISLNDLCTTLQASL